MVQIKRTQSLKRKPQKSLYVQNITLLKAKAKSIELQQHCKGRNYVISLPPNVLFGHVTGC
jgi:hypothetical protein